MMCQGYGADNCDEQHDTKDGSCDCFTGLTMSDFNEEAIARVGKSSN